MVENGRQIRAHIGNVRHCVINIPQNQEPYFPQQNIFLNYISCTGVFLCETRRTHGLIVDGCEHQ